MRVTVIVTLAVPSVTVYWDALNWSVISSSVMVSVAVVGLPRMAPPSGVSSERLSARLKSTMELGRIVTGKVRIITPVSKLSVPEADS